MDVTQMRYRGEKFKLYNQGSYDQEMPRLIADGRRPASVADIVMARNDSSGNLPISIRANAGDTLKPNSDYLQPQTPREVWNAIFLWFNDFHTADGFYNGATVLRPRQLEEARDGDMRHGVLPLSDSIEGLTVVGPKMKVIGGVRQPAEDDSNWKYILGGNGDFLNGNENFDGYLSNAYALSRLMRLDECMGMHFPSESPKPVNGLVPIIIQSAQRGSGLETGSRLDFRNARLLGIKIRE